MPHSKAWKFKPQSRLEPALKHWWQARKADVLAITPQVVVMVVVVAVVVGMVAVAGGNRGELGCCVLFCVF